VDRCHDATLTEALLRAREGAGLSATGHPSAGLSGSSAGLSGAGLSGAGPAGRPPATGQATLFGPAEPGVAEAREVLRALVGGSLTNCAGSPATPTRAGSLLPPWSLRAAWAQPR
jgi:hypothetical protein